MILRNLRHRAFESPQLYWTCIVGLLMLPSVSSAQELNPDALARASREKLANEVAAVTGVELRAKLISSTENRTLAQWYAGEIQQNDRWITLREAELEAAQDEQWREYAEQRAQAADSLHDHELLARWCEKNSLDKHAEMHWLHVLRFNNSHRAALSSLGLTWHEGLLLTDEEAKNYKRTQKEQTKLTKRWRGKIKRLRHEVEAEDVELRQAAEENLLAIRDVEALPALIDEFAQPA